MRRAVVAAIAVLLTGCGVSQTALSMAGPVNLRGGSPVRSSGETKWVYVTNMIKSGSSWASTVTIYSASSNGNVSPVAVIGGSQTQLSQVAGIVVDDTGEIYVANIDSNSIVGFARGSSGNVAPNVVIAGSQTGLSRPTGLALDENRNMYVGNCASGCNDGSAPPALLEFAAGSNGNVAPIRDIVGPKTKLANSNAPAVDPWGNIYVSNWIANTIDVFDKNANGNTRPIRVVAGSKTLLDGPDGIAVDRHWLFAGSANEHDLTRFVLDAAGNQKPVAVISGVRTRLYDVDGICVTRNVLYASNPGSNRIVKFAALANGDVRPLGQIYGSNTELNQPVWVYAK